MPLRRPHTKSCKGCRECKKRRIKCDEQAPVCGSCTRRGIICEWGLPTPSNSEREQSYNSLLNSPLVSTPESFSSSTSAELAITSASTNFAFSFDDLELIHHYTINTYASVSPHDRGDSQLVWQTIIPKIAKKHPYLMHGLLGASALHLSYLHPNEKMNYLNRAQKHQNLSQQLFYTAVNDVSPANCEAVFGFSGMAVVLAFGMPHACGVKVGFTDMLGIVELMRCTCSILRGNWEFLQNVIRSHNLPQVDALPRPLTDAMDALRSVAQTSASVDAEREAALKAIDDLQHAFRYIPVDSEGSGHPLRWPIFLSDEFLHMLQAQKPLALVILAHFCVLLEHDPHRWYMEGWNREVVDDINGLLDESRRKAIQFPLSQLGLAEGALSLWENPITEVLGDSSSATSDSPMRLSSP